MRTRSSGPAKDPITGEIFLDSPQSTIPAFIHEPVPFKPFPEAAFPTLEFPVPQPSERHERARRIVLNNRGGLSTSGRGGSPGSVTSIQRETRGVSPLAQRATHGARTQLEENPSTSKETISRNRPELFRWVATLKPGEFKNDPYWTDDNELHSQLPTMEKSYDVIPTWSDLTPGVQIVVMIEMVESFGIDDAPELLELTSEEINKYVNLQESEAQAQKAEDERIRQYNDHRFQQMLAGKIDGSNSMEILDLHFSQGSIWEPTTFAMKMVDLKAGSRFLLSLGFKNESENLWRYYGMDGSMGYDFRPSGPTATNDAQGVDSPKTEPTINMIDDEITGQSDEPLPKSRRNPSLNKVKREKKPKPQKSQPPLESAPCSPAHTPSKLRICISVDEILSEEPSDAEETGSVKARVARQVPPGTDLSKAGKAVKYTKPARQWADAPNARRGSKEQYMRKQKPKAAPEKRTSYVDLTESKPDPPVTPEKQKDQNSTYLQPPSENDWFAPLQWRPMITAAGAMMGKALPGAGYHPIPVVKNVAEFANPRLAAKWAKNPKPTEKSSFEETAKGPVLRRRSTLDPRGNGSNGVTSKEPLAGTSVQDLNETKRSKRKTITSDELLSPFDASTPGRANKRQKWKEGTAVRTRQLSIQEQYVADEDVPIEMLNAGEQILMTRPRMATRTTRKKNGVATTGEGRRNGKGDGTRKNSGA
ncbi:hypothetical protein V502_04525 [Pseudogymnoascus sp. VKM F-4520 (FW-2644)]|nr:hypothetical protein V502_04525 [Pseudogymnoascus sp. VKM F-4520 (FW-2644)]